MAGQRIKPIHHASARRALADAVEECTHCRPGSMLVALD
ncbi:DUF6233 domain-containing protein [Streptomyces sp. NPDC046985]